MIDKIDTDSKRRPHFLEQIQNMCNYSYKFEDVWEECFTGVLDSVVECMEDENLNTKECAIKTMKILIIHHGKMVDS